MLEVRQKNCEIEMANIIDVNGGCFCGKITLQAHVLEENVVACHCTDCQKFSGAPFRATLIIDAAHVKITGEVREYSKIAESGNERLQGFCGNCGSHIYATSPDRKIYNIRAGCLEQHNELAPVRHIFGQSSPDWLVNIAKAKWFKKGPASEEIQPRKDG